MKSKILSLALCAAVVIVSKPRMGTALLSTNFSTEKAFFAVKYKNEVSSFRVTPLFVLPGEKVSLSIDQPSETASYELTSAAGQTTVDSPTSWTWVAPKKSGMVPIAITETSSGDSIACHAFVMVPYAKVKNGALNGYKIGRYPTQKNKGVHYDWPRGFVEITPENKHLMVSPHFRLGQFLCKQQGKYPKYVVLQEKLLFKLEHLLTSINDQGIDCPSFHVMSGYRTPYYNSVLKNVRYSRHLFGDAADIFIDNDKDNFMDDLNKDGVSDAKDSEFLFNVVNGLEDTPDLEKYLGGLGRYKGNKAHGPFIHVDARGTNARWKN